MTGKKQAAKCYFLQRPSCQEAFYAKSSVLHLVVKTSSRVLLLPNTTGSCKTFLFFYFVIVTHAGLSTPPAAPRVLCVISFKTCLFFLSLFKLGVQNTYFINSKTNEIIINCTKHLRVKTRRKKKSLKIVFCIRQEFGSASV